MIVNENANYSINDLIPVIESCIASGSSVRMQVTGISMTPILHNLKDTVVLSKADTIKKYDIVLHKRVNGQYILHRVIAKKGNVLTIAGDFETEKEYPVYEDMVKLYSRLWVLIFPIRHQVLYTLNVMRRIFHV